MNEAFVAFWSTLILICRTFHITLCDKSCDLERKYVVFATPVSQKWRRQPISFVLDSLSAQMNVPDTTFSRNTMKLLNHNASTLSLHLHGYEVQKQNIVNSFTSADYMSKFSFFSKNLEIQIFTTIHGYSFKNVLKWVNSSKWIYSSYEGHLVVVVVVFQFYEISLQKL